MMARTNETSFDDAQAWCDLAEAVDLGRIASANRIAGEHRLAIDRLWAPEDDGLQQAARKSTMRSSSRATGG